MHPTQFERILERQIEDCREILGVKRDEYAPDADVLSNFRKAAGLKGQTMRQALAGMMAKHTVSIYDLCERDEPASYALWKEKITDHMNYLILLLAIVHSELEESGAFGSPEGS